MRMHIYTNSSGGFESGDQLPKIVNRNVVANPVVVVDECPSTVRPNMRDFNHETTFQTFDEMEESTLHEPPTHDRFLDSKLQSVTETKRGTTLKTHQSNSNECILEKKKQPESQISSRRSLPNNCRINITQGQKLVLKKSLDFNFETVSDFNYKSFRRSLKADKALSPTLSSPKPDIFMPYSSERHKIQIQATATTQRDS